MTDAPVTEELAYTGVRGSMAAVLIAMVLILTGLVLWATGDYVSRGRH